MASDQAEVAVRAILGHRLADDDLELAFPIMPVSEVCAVDPDDDGLEGMRPLLERTLGA